MCSAIALGTFSPWGFERWTDTFPLGMDRLAQCTKVADALGAHPRKTWGFSNFHIGSSGQTGSARFTIMVRGDRTHGEYQFAASRTFERWTLTSARLLLPQDERIIDGLNCRVEPKPGSSPQEMFEALCEGDEASACLMLAIMYKDGSHGVSQNFARARILADRACELGLPTGCSLLSD